MVMDKKKLSEQDIRTKFITPAIIEAGWDKMSQIREEHAITDGRIHVRGSLAKRGKPKIADYVLFYKPNMPIAIVEAKDNKHSVGEGMQQALNYAEMMNVPFVYSSNGDAFLERDQTEKEGTIEREIPMDTFPSPQQLWQRYLNSKGITDKEEEVMSQDYYLLDLHKTPRYYQMIAINRTVEAIALGKNRMLMVMATGTGKTYTAFQIIYRLWKAGCKKRILYLADRNVLVDQPKTNEFKSFEEKMTKISRQTVSKAHEIYFGLYQSLTGPEEEHKAFKQYSPDFFDLVLVDECHRGSAADDSQWREILDYFNSAAHIGMTATPKETQYVSNINYFGDPLYTYSLKQGIQDGFLAPYKVIRITTDKDDGYRPAQGETDKYGHEVPDRIYNLRDFDKKLVLERRTTAIARRITEFLKKTRRFDKTIVFCVDREHADLMRRELVNQNSDMVHDHRNYIVRITGDDPTGQLELDNFKDPDEVCPVIATTSKLLSTGVDTKTCKLIVIDKTINSLIEFKQIIGRGTRVDEDYGKMFFTIMDFRRATNHFADPDFDGDPVMVYDVGEDEPIPGPEEELHPESPITGDIPGEEGIIFVPGLGGAGTIEYPEPPYGDESRKYYIDNVEVRIVNERVLITDADGTIITESVKDYCRKTIHKEYATLDEFLNRWSTAQQKNAVIEELAERGVFFEELEKEVGKEFGAFDLICHVAFDRPPLTRKERAENVRKHDYFSKYGDTARKVLNALLDKYADEGIEDIEDMGVLRVQPFNTIGSPVEIVKAFGSKQKYLQALKELENLLYEAA